MNNVFKCIGFVFVNMITQLAAFYSDQNFSNTFNKDLD